MSMWDRSDVSEELLGVEQFNGTQIKIGNVIFVTCLTTFYLKKKS